jgi:hypothetical protein
MNDLPIYGKETRRFPNVHNVRKQSYDWEALPRSPNVEDTRGAAYDGFIRNRSLKTQYERANDGIDYYVIRREELSTEGNNPYYETITNAMYSASNPYDEGFDILTREEFNDYITQY